MEASGALYHSDTGGRRWQAVTEKNLREGRGLEKSGTKEQEKPHPFRWLSGVIQEQ